MIKRKLFCLMLVLLCASCTAKKDNILKVAATAVPHAEMLDYIKPDMAKEGIDLMILVVEDYNIPNRALADKEVDANFFQHLPFMQEQVKMFHYPIVSDGKIEIEPMGVYSRKIKAIDELKEKAVIAIPNDPANEARALILLHNHGIITLDNPQNLQATVLNIIQNPKQIQFQEIDAAMLPRSLQDVDAAAINTNFALQANLNPLKDALIREDASSPYVNIIAIRIDEKEDPRLAVLKKQMTSEKMKRFILEKYKGAVIPAF